MTHWKLTLAYNGSGFHGWQVQPGLTTVQGTLAQALKRLTGEDVLPQGAGRTDAGVHALAQITSFALASPLPPGNLHRALNRVLPPGVRVLSAEIADPGFHARHSARGKLYEYRIFERRTQTASESSAQERICSPFLAPFVWDCRWALQLDALKDAAARILGTHDFSAMAASSRPEALAASGDEFVGSSSLDSQPDNDPKPRASKPNPVKTIHNADWDRSDGLMIFRVRGTGFLHHMVRNLVGTMVDIGRGSLAPADLSRILASCDRTQAGPTAPARGLFLVEVVYDCPSQAPTHEIAQTVEAIC